MNTLLSVRQDLDVAHNHVADNADSQRLYCAVTVHKPCAHQADTADVVYVTIWVAYHVQVFVNQVKVAATEVAKAKVIYTLVHYLNQIKKVISA
jgi:hypothetical protein